MDLSARDINNKQFNDAWRGYNQEEVDDFLDRVAEVLDRVRRENASLQSRIQELDHAVSTSRDTEEMLKKTLVTAQKAAEEAIASAKAKAEQLIDEAEQRVRGANDEARVRIQSVEEEVRRRTIEADRDHTAHKRELDTSLERLGSFESEMKQRLRAFLEQQLKALETLVDREPPRTPIRPPMQAPTQRPAARPEERSTTEPSVRTAESKPEAFVQNRTPDRVRPEVSTAPEEGRLGPGRWPAQQEAASGGRRSLRGLLWGDDGPSSKR